MSSPLQFRGDLTCSIDVGDLAKGVAWYRDVLGFDVLYEMKEMSWAELQTEVPGVTVGLNGSAPGMEGGATLVFGVKDIEAAKQILVERKVELKGDIQTIPDMVKLLVFKDPFGNKLMFSQNLQAGT
jgi:predicted enzyme related to lactoylglutathione lyase